MDERYERDAHSTRDANVHVGLGSVYLAVCCLFSSPVEAYQKGEEPFVNEATGTTDAGWNSVANHPKGLGVVGLLRRIWLLKNSQSASSDQTSHVYASQDHPPSLTHYPSS